MVANLKKVNNNWNIYELFLF